jgi:hypothetical protein
VEGLQKKVDYQKCQIEDYHELVEKGKVEFKRICQNFENLNNRVLGGKIKVFFAKRNCNVIRTLYSNFWKRLSYQNLVATLLSNLVNKLRFEKPLLIGLCPFCGLGFTPLWVGKITSCKHVFHCRWAYSQLGTYPKGLSNGKKTTKDYFGFLLHLLLHDYNGLVYDYRVQSQ